MLSVYNGGIKKEKETGKCNNCGIIDVTLNTLIEVS
jgi:Fe-S cluster biogenesis protein NfuA